MVEHCTFPCSEHSKQIEAPKAGALYKYLPAPTTRVGVVSCNDGDYEAHGRAYSTYDAITTPLSPPFSGDNAGSPVQFNSLVH